MEILYYFKEEQTPMYQWQRYHIFDELKKYGVSITVFNPLEHFSKDNANESLISCIKKNKIDLFMTPHGSDDLFIETLLKIKEYGIPTLLICFDNLIVPFSHRKICKYFDLVWLTSKETEYMFLEWGANVLFNPYAANPYFFMPHYESEIEKIAFIGTPYGSRVNMLNILTANEVNVSLYSNPSSTVQMGTNSQRIQDYFSPAYNLLRFGIGRRVIWGAIKQKAQGTNLLDINSDHLERWPAVGLEDLSKLYSNYALSLASTAARNTGVLKNPVNIVNLRSFEIPMSGGLQICSYFDELADYFEEDKEILFYRTEEEFIEKTKFYLKPDNKNIRMSMKKEARKRAENEHTWFSRFKKVFDYFDLKYL